MPRSPTDRRQGDRLLTATDVARRFDTNVETVRRWVKKGAIQHVCVGPFHLVRIPIAEAARHFRAK